MQVEWAKSHAYAQWWLEEVVLVIKEMHWVIQHLDWKASWWQSQGPLRSSVTWPQCWQGQLWPPNLFGGHWPDLRSDHIWPEVKCHWLHVGQNRCWNWYNVIIVVIYEMMKTQTSPATTLSQPQAPTPPLTSNDDPMSLTALFHYPNQSAISATTWKSLAEFWRYGEAGLRNEEVFHEFVHANPSESGIPGAWYPSFICFEITDNLVHLYQIHTIFPHHYILYLQTTYSLYTYLHTQHFILVLHCIIHLFLMLFDEWWFRHPF